MPNNIDNTNPNLSASRSMDLSRRNCLTSSLALGARFLMPSGIVALVGCQGHRGTAARVGFSGSIMGTRYSVRVDDAALAQADVSIDVLSQQVHAALSQVDKLMSTWRLDSEVSLFNSRVDDDWLSITSSSLEVITHAMTIAEQSAGAFDLTIGPLVDLWGFGAASQSAPSTVPQRRNITKTLAQVGFQAIEVDAKASAIRKLNPAAQLDLSGIAKGFAVDRASQVLDEAGIGSYLVELGGELRARGRKSDGLAWKVAIERPASTQDRDALRVLNLANSAIATSGDYRHFFVDGGQHYSHSIDPRTGMPVSHELASVSVVAPTTMAADALSTTLMILGPHDAMTFADRHKIPAHFVLKSGTAMKEVFSTGFEALIS